MGSYQKHTGHIEKRVRNLRKEKGFTLIEVLFAIVILAFGLLAVASMQSGAIQGNSVAYRVTEAATLAQDRMEGLLALQYTDPLLDAETNLPDPSPPAPTGYVIDYDVDDTTLTNAKIITVRVVRQFKGITKPPITLICVNPELPVLCPCRTAQSARRRAKQWRFGA